MRGGMQTILLFFFLAGPFLVAAQQKTTHVPPKKTTQEDAEKEKREREKKDKELIKAFDIKAIKGDNGATGSMSGNTMAANFYRMAMGSINTKYIQWVKTNAQKLNDENLDEWSIQLLAKSIGKQASLNQKDMDGLQVLLLQETYNLTTKAYYEKLMQLATTRSLKEELQKAQKLLNDSTGKMNPAMLDSIQKMLRSIPEKPSNKPTSELAENETEKPANLARVAQTPEGKDVAGLSHTKNLLTEKLAAVSQQETAQSQEASAIQKRQKRIADMLSKMSKDVSDSQENIIRHLQ